MKTRIDLPRSTFVGVAAVLAAVGAGGGLVDTGMGGAATATRNLGIEAFVDVAFIAVPAGVQWSLRRRWLAAVAAIIWALDAFLLLVSYGARAACGCGDPASGYMLPVYFGTTAANWMMIGALAGPLLMTAAASSLPDRLTRRRQRST
ncbi:MAG: hypothetical protein ABSE70_04720 [Candidatus Limnocylindrales bacterium]